MGHVVDEVVFHLGQFLLPESHDNREYKYDKQYQRERKRRHHERDRREDIIFLCREVDFQIVEFAAGIVGEQSLDKHVVGRYARGHIPRRLVLDSAEIVDHGIFKRHSYAESIELLTQVAADNGRIGAFAYRPLARAADDVEDHIVDHAFLIVVLILIGLAVASVVLACRSASAFEFGDFVGCPFERDIAFET